jgi:hypothetical protein
VNEYQRELDRIRVLQRDCNARLKENAKRISSCVGCVERSKIHAKREGANNALSGFYATQKQLLMESNELQQQEHRLDSTVRSIFVVDLNESKGKYDYEKQFSFQCDQL